MWYATGLDCGQTRRVLADKSHDKAKKIALLKGWMELPGGQDSGVTAGRAVDLATRNPTKYATLWNALMSYGRDGKPANSTSIGRKISGIKDNPIAGMRFEENGFDHSAALWRVATSQSDLST